MRTDKTVALTARTYLAERAPSIKTAATIRVLAAVWCRSVGTSWTLELHALDESTALGRVVDWISSGVPIVQPEPDAALARDLLATRGLHLFGDSSAGPRTDSRRGIGYACRDAELITLARLVAEDATEAGVHPLLLAARWVTAGFSADAAAGWIHEGVRSPQVAQHQTVYPTPTM
jgi:hypothetical protein